MPLEPQEATKYPAEPPAIDIFTVSPNIGRNFLH